MIENGADFEALTAYTVELLNRIYYREFDINSVGDVLQRIDEVDVRDCYGNSDRLFDLISLPYMIEINLESYRRWSTPEDGGSNAVVEAISEMAGKLHHLIGDKVRAIR